MCSGEIASRALPGAYVRTSESSPIPSQSLDGFLIALGRVWSTKSYLPFRKKFFRVLPRHEGKKLGCKLGPSPRASGHPCMGISNAWLFGWPAHHCLDFLGWPAPHALAGFLPASGKINYTYAFEHPLSALPITGIFLFIILKNSLALLTFSNPCHRLNSSPTAVLVQGPRAEALHMFFRLIYTWIIFLLAG